MAPPDDRSSAPKPPLHAGGEGYADLLSATRGLPQDRRAARDRWFADLTVDGKEDALFEFEVLLKATACFSNPRNHPGPARRAPVVATDFREATVLFKEGAQHATALARQLLGPRDRAFVFHRYLETVLPEDRIRTRLIREGARQSSPVDSLVALRHSLTTTVEVADGVLRAPRVGFRLFYALLAMSQREIGHNAYFNPLTALEFRPEFDRIHSAQVLELIRSVHGEEAHRLVSLTFLSLFRMLRYLRLLGRIAVESTGRRRRAAGRAYLVLSVLRSDARALSDHLRQNSGLLLARSFERDLMSVPRAEILQQAAHLRSHGHRLIGVKSALEGIAGSLRLEMRRAFQHDLPSPEQRPSDHDLRQSLGRTVVDLRPAIRNAILFLGRALGVSLEEGGVFDDQAAKRETSERLRRDVWIFAQIVRAFATKAQHSPGEDRWAALESFQYVREFLAYFQAMGYPLLRAADYPRFDTFMAAIGRLGDTDLVDPARLESAIDECMAFNSFLQKLFDDISKRDVLRNVPFDRRSAAESLKLYLGD